MNHRPVWILILVAALAVPAFAKSKAQALPAGPPDPEVSVDLWGEEGWEDQGTGDWTLAPHEPRGGVDAQVLVPFAEGSPGALVLVTSAEARGEVKDPSGSRAFVAFNDTRTSAALGARFGAGGTWVQATAGARALTNLGGDRDYEPAGADAAAFWTRVLPGAGLDGRGKADLGWTLVQGRASGWLGWDADDGWPMAAASAQATAAFWSAVEVTARSSWISGPEAPETKADLGLAWKGDRGKRLAWKVTAYRWNLTGPATWAAQADFGPSSQTLTLETGGTWSLTPQVTLGLTLHQEF